MKANALRPSHTQNLADPQVSAYGLGDEESSEEPSHRWPEPMHGELHQTRTKRACSVMATMF